MMHMSAPDRIFGLTINLFGYFIFGRGWVGLALLDILFVVSMLVGVLATIRLWHIPST